MKKKIGLVGYFGWGNFGDELFLAAHRQHLSADYDLEVVHDLLHEPYFSNADLIAEKYDAFLIGGGDLLNPIRVSPLYWQEAYLAKPVFVYGIGVPNVKWSRQNVLDTYRAFLRHPNCKLVVPRDRESYTWINDNIGPAGQMEWFPDPVCSLQRAKAKAPSEKTLGVVMRSHRSISDDLTPVRDMIDKAKEMGYRIRHIVLGTLEIGKADLAVARNLAKADEDIFVSESLNDLCQAISSCSLLASIKFHGMVVAAMYGVPTIAMSVTPKNRNFLRMLERPEMLRGYTDKDLYKCISYYPASIPTAVREKLFQESSNGYSLLRQKLMENLGESLRTKEQPEARNKGMEMPRHAEQLIASSHSGPSYDAKSLLKRAEGRLGELPRRLGVDPSMLAKARILEVGCGNGECTAAAIRQFDADAFGIDIVPRWEDGPYESLGREGRLRLLNASGIETVSLGKFDFVHSYTVLEHVEKPQAALENIFRVLKAGGRAFLSFNLYLGASASHLSGYLPDIPWIHLTHTDAEARAIMKQRYGIDRGFAWVNKWTFQNYIDACEQIGFKIDKCWYVRKAPTPEFYERHKGKLSQYSMSDLSRNFMNVTLVRPD